MWLFANWVGEKHFFPSRRSRLLPSQLARRSGDRPRWRKVIPVVFQLFAGPFLPFDLKKVNFVNCPEQRAKITKNSTISFPCAERLPLPFMSMGSTRAHEEVSISHHSSSNRFGRGYRKIYSVRRSSSPAQYHCATTYNDRRGDYTKKSYTQCFCLI